MGVAKLASQRSKDPSTQNGACIVDPDTKRILSVGYNGLPKGLDDNGCHIENYPPACPKEGLIYDYWEKPQKYDYSVHAEENALIAGRDLTGSVIYIYSEKGYYPCSRCARGIIQSGITEVILNTAINHNTETYDWKPTLHMFEKANIEIRVLNEKIV